MPPQMKSKFQKSKKTLTQKVDRIEKQLKEDTPDIKSLDLPIAFTSLTTSGYSVLTAQIAEGTDYNQRIGLGVNISSIDVKLNVAIGATASATNIINYPNMCQAFLVKDLQTTPNSTSLTLTDVWVAPSQYPSVFRTIQTHSRYKVLESSNVINIQRCANQALFIGAGAGGVVNQLSGVPTQNPFMHLRHKFAFKLKTMFNASGATNVQKNAVYLVVLYGNQEAGSDDNLFIQGNCRVNYLDD